MVQTGRGHAILARRGRDLEFIEGDAFTVDAIASIPIPSTDESCVLAVIPFRQIVERGYTCHDDGLGIQVLVGDKLPQDCLRNLNDSGGEPFRLSGLRFEPDDSGYESLVADVIDREIGGGSGSNFVIHRRLRAQADTTQTDWLEDGAQATLANLLSRDPSAYWRFWICLPEVSLIGSSPELHLGYESGRVWMTPMSGTLRVDHSTNRAALDEFMRSRKELEELFMVLDEELKMLCRMTPSSVTVSGPNIDIFGGVIHTYFKIRADTTLDIHDLLTQSLFAPTVTGSPLREAFDVITRNEWYPRGYYGGVICRLSRRGRAIMLDSAIAIRTAYIEPDGQISIPVGATIVRHSTPRAEAEETASKASGLLAALQGNYGTAPSYDLRGLLEDVHVLTQLEKRRSQMSEFWISGSACMSNRFCDKRALIVDFDDDWTSVLAFLISSFGIQCNVVSWRTLDNRPNELSGWFANATAVTDLLILGPGPGDPADDSQRRMRVANRLAGIAMADPIPTLAVCLSHQCMSRLFGFRLGKLDQPFQGTARIVPIADTSYSLAFYNSYTAYCDPADLSMMQARRAEVWFDPGTGEVFGFSAPGTVSVQFHLESAISRDGIAVAEFILSELFAE